VETEDYGTVEASALRLPPEQRTRLIERLMDSLDGEEGGGRWIDVRAEQAWLGEIERRHEAFERGEVTLIEHEEVMARLFAEFGRSPSEDS